MCQDVLVGGGGQEAPEMFGNSHPTTPQSSVVGIRGPRRIAIVAASAVMVLALPGAAAASFGPPVDIFTVTGDCFRQQVATDANGGATVVWTCETGTTTPLRRVKSRRIAADGTLGSIKNLTSATLNADSPQVSVDPTGRASAVWIFYDGQGAERVRTRTIATDGTLGTVNTLSAAGQVASHPHVGTDSSGRATVVWQRFDGANQRVQSRTIAADGTVGAVKTLSSAGQDATDPQVSVDPFGRATVVWQRFDGAKQRVQSRTIAADGTVGSISNLSAAGQDAGGPQLAGDSTGRATVVWARFDGTVNRIQSRPIAADGTLGSTRTLSAVGPEVSEPHVAVDPTGRAAVIWGRASDTTQFIRVQGRTIAADGTPGSTKWLSADGQHVNEPQVAIDSDGLATVLWTLEDLEIDEATDFSHIQARSIAADGTLGAVETVSADGVDADSPRAAGDPAGGAVIVWEKDNGTDETHGIQYARS